MQLNLALDPQVLPELSTLDGASAAPVRAAVQGLLHEPGARLMLTGVRGTGKTHVLNAACRAAAEARLRAFYIPLADPAFASPEAMDQIWNADLLCIDDVQAVAGDVQRETALFRCYNECEANRTRLLLAARATPHELGLRLADLVSRLSACVLLRMTPLDEAAMQRVMAARARERGAELSENALRFLLRRAPRNMHDLDALLARLVELAHSEKRSISVAAVRKWVETRRLDL